MDSARLDLVSVLPASVRNCGFLTWFPGFLVSLYLTPHPCDVICHISNSSAVCSRVQSVLGSADLPGGSFCSKQFLGFARQLILCSKYYRFVKDTQVADSVSTTRSERRIR